MLTVFLVLFAVLSLLLLTRIPMELVGLLALLALALLGAIDPRQATVGFGDGVVITMGGLFVVGGALIKTGLAQMAGSLLQVWSRGSHTRLLCLVVLAAATLSTVLSSTGTVALLIPAVVGAAQSAGRSPSKYLIPLAYGSLIGGMFTVIGSTPNLIVNESLKELGRPGFGFFSFSWLGAPVLLCALLYLLTLGSRLLPDRKLAEGSEVPLTLENLLREYEVMDDLFEIELPPEGSWQCASLGELRLRSEFHIDVLAVREVGTGAILYPSAGSPLVAGSVLYARADAAALQRFSDRFGVDFQRYRSLPAPESLRGIGLAEVILVPRSRLDGKSLAESRFSRRFGVRVIRVRRSGRTLAGDVAETRLRFGDALLVQGPVNKLSDLAREKFDFVVVSSLGNADPGRLTGQGKLALLITAVMLLAITAGWLTPALAAVAAAVAVTLTGCLTVEEAYSSIQWGSLFLVASMLPLGTALSNSGGIDFLTAGLIETAGTLGPRAVLLGIYLVTTLLGQVMSNTATTLILTPLAVQAAQMIGVAPEPLLMGVAFGASTAFLTPIASPVNTLVVAPGNYQFLDFLKVGLPLHLMASTICVLVIPLAFPFALKA
jgi:di/tricarboxylate transporter